MENEPNNGARGVLVVISGPSGAGKTTIARQVVERLGAKFSVSATTRPPAPMEVDGRDYFFITEEEFARRIDEGEFLEYAQVFGRHHYGTPRAPVERDLQQGRLVLLEIDVQGGMQIRQSMPDAFMIFILPPNETDLMHRLRGRGRDSEEAIRRRFSEATSEIERAKQSGVYDAFVVNDDLEKAIDETCELIRKRLGLKDQGPGVRC